MASPRGLKLSGASSGEASIPKERILNMIRSLTTSALANSDGRGMRSLPNSTPAAAVYFKWTAYRPDFHTESNLT